MTGTYPQFMQTQDGQSILGRQPTLQDLLTALQQGAPTPVVGGGFGGTPTGLGSPGGAGGQIFGAGDLALGGGARGLPMIPGSRPATSPVAGQGVTTGATSLTQAGGGGGVGGAGGQAPSGIGRGQLGSESGEAFAAANAAVNPSLRSSLNLAGMVMNPVMGMPMQLLGSAFPNLNLGSLFGLGTGFNVKGPQLSPQQLNQIAMAYQQNPALAARLLATMRQQANIAGGQMGAGMLSGTGQTPLGSFGTMPGTSELTANFTSPGFGLNPPALGYGGYATWGGPGGGFAGGGGLGGSPDTGGGLGGGPGNMGGGQNRSM